MKIEMIVSDLDRTLLRTDKTISDYSADIFSRCRAKGIKIVFATARSKRSIGLFCEKIPTDALVVHNGAVAYVGNELHTRFGIEVAERDNILLSMSRDIPELALSVEIDETLYANFDVSEVWHGVDFIRADFKELPDKIADKIVVGSSVPLDMERLEKYIPEELYIEASKSEVAHIAMVMNRKATKLSAVKSVAESLGIQVENVVAFGDDFNDISTIRGCGTGVAVFNAIDEVKSAADYICDTNDNDGVAKWLAENLLTQ